MTFRNSLMIFGINPYSGNNNSLTGSDDPTDMSQHHNNQLI